MPALKISLDIACLRLSLQKSLHIAAQLGVEAVEIDARGDVRPSQFSQTGLRQLRKMLDDLGLRVSSVRFRTRRGYATMADLDARIEATKTAMQFAADLGARVVTNHIGRVPTESDSESERLLIEVLNDLGRHGNRVGALLATETGSESGPELAQFLDKLPDGTLGVDLNPGNLIVNGHSPLEAVAALGSSILHVHATDGAQEPSSGSGDRASLGEGSADFPGLLGALDQHAYQGYFTVASQSVDRATDELAQLVGYLRQF